MKSSLEEYEILIKKYYALQQLINEQFEEALEGLEAAISNIENSLDYLKSQKVIRSKINCWLREYGDLYDLNSNSSQCSKLVQEMRCLTSELIALDQQALCMSKNTKCTIQKAQRINAKLARLKKEYDTNRHE